MLDYIKKKITSLFQVIFSFFLNKNQPPITIEKVKENIPIVEEMSVAKEINIADRETPKLDEQLRTKSTNITSEFQEEIKQDSDLFSQIQEQRAKSEEIFFKADEERAELNAKDVEDIIEKTKEHITKPIEDMEKERVELAAKVDEERKQQKQERLERSAKAYEERKQQEKERAELAAKAEEDNTKNTAELIAKPKEDITKHTAELIAKAKEDITKHTAELIAKAKKDIEKHTAEQSKDIKDMIEKANKRIVKLREDQELFNANMKYVFIPMIKAKLQKLFGIHPLNNNAQQQLNGNHLPQQNNLVMQVQAQNVDQDDILAPNITPHVSATRKLSRSRAA